MRTLCGLGLTGVVIACLALGGCDSDDDDVLPSVSILSPLPGATVSLGDELVSRVVIVANEFDLEELGGCDDDDFNCGRALLNIDGDACNAPGLPFNNLTTGDDGNETSIDALFFNCPQATVFGLHTLRVSLVDNAGAPVIGVGGLAAQASLSITTVP